MADGSDRGDVEPWEIRRIEFAPAELKVLFEACQMYRARLPSYLRCAKPELELIEGILKKIT